MSIQKVITANGTEHLTARMMRENLALVFDDRSRLRHRYQVITLNSREFWDFVDFGSAHIPRPTEYLKSVFCSVNEAPATPASVPSAPVQGVPGHSNTQGADCPDSSSPNKEV